MTTQYVILIEHAVIPHANHFFENCVDTLITEVSAYLDKRLDNPVRTAIPARTG